jgi:transposase-like protein
MELNLHANATTTPKVRTYIQRSKRPVTELAAELGVSETTIRRWRGRTTVDDRSHTPKTLQTNFSTMEETLVCELRTQLQLPLDDIVEVMRRCVNGKLSRSAIHRCLKRHGLSQRPKPDRPAVGAFERTTVGFIHIDLKHLPALERRKSYAFVAIDRTTRYVYLEIHPKRDADTSVGFLERFLAHFPHAVHTILTDNGAEFTDRFAVDMRNKPKDKPSGRHPFDRLCTKRGIQHRLTRPYRPQTNGLVERFNRRIVDAIGREPKRGIARRLFRSHTDRNAFLNRFVHDYNRTRLKCLDYLAPLEALANLPGPNTCAGTTTHMTSPVKQPAAINRRGFAISRRDAPEFCKTFYAHKEEGAGKTGCALHPRSRVQSAHQKKRTRAYRFSGSSPAFPAQWFYGLFRALPGDRAFLPPSPLRSVSFPGT